MAPRSIVFIGFMGAGKSTAARAVAGALGVDVLLAERSRGGGRRGGLAGSHEADEDDRWRAGAVLGAYLRHPIRSS